jgi:hypothetical protein
MCNGIVTVRIDYEIVDIVDPEHSSPAGDGYHEPYYSAGCTERPHADILAWELA